ncbi:MAG: iron-containing alcohol dehydrogenase [Reyranella sp.]|uniref:iron-containing alcohol dehydrogenase n=1 Tax=Reyranella sp. TaxID=1929291 RepID=UPI001ACBF6B2|nr:iron-containing alcohol dehydrogenase [Reyranella sp.]MBN9087495.1 iron-containing alcohol dehydrogenase [Reyranella sp.]
MLNGIHGHQDIERVVYGRPAGAAVRAEAERLGAKRVFVTTTKSVAQSALLADVIKELGDRYAGIYAGITAHSPRPCVVEGAQRAREAKADLIVTVGGGSAIDATKVMLIALWQNVATIEALDPYRAGRPREGAAPPSEAIKPPADAIRMIAVPTTLSAAEFNAYAGISDPRHGIKESFGHRLIVPRVIVLDPAATLATPMDLMLSTGLKAVDHAVERLCSQQANPFAIGTSTEALRLLTRALPAHKAHPDDMEARLNLQFGMWLSIGAGTSGVGVGASHGIGHVLGAACHVPHGHTSCVMLPSVLRWNLAVNAERQKRVSEAFGKPAEPAADLVANLVATLGLPRRLSEVGVGRDRFREIAEKSMHDRAVLNNPRPIKGPAEVMEILELAA